MFRTPLNIVPAPFQIDVNKKILSIGSCFAQNTGQKLTDFKFLALINPFGVLFNPASIFRIIKKVLDNEKIGEGGITQVQGVFRHFDTHSDLSDMDRDNLLGAINERAGVVRSFIQQTDIFILTFGTAIVYERKDTGEVVANCHKVPSDFFIKRLLSIDEIVAGFRNIYDHIRSIRPEAKFILTVSPVRHIKDSFEKNNVSKSILRLAVENISSENENIIYFPSFEIMMDDLRDYRFYGEDMVHPNDLAINYIWQQFVNTFMTDGTKDFIGKWFKIRKAINHRPFFPQTEEHQKFLRQTIRQLESFRDIVDVNQELHSLKSQLI